MSKKILLIDDDEIVLESLGRLLESQGYDVERARNGLQALDKAQSQNLHLVISDIRMPGMDGIEVIQRLRDIHRDRGRKSIPEILITGYTDENTYLRALKLKVTDYLYKPFDLAQFLSLVAKRLEI